MTLLLCHIRAHILARASSSLPCSPPKPPLLMMSTWSPLAGAAREAAHQLIDRARQPPLGTERCHHGIGVPAEVRRREHPHRIRGRQRRRQRVAMHAHAHGGRARLEHGDDALAADLAAQPVDGRGDGRGVMREIVVHRDAAHFAAQFHAAFHALEFRERRDGLRHGNAGVPRGADGGQRILGVVRA